MPLSEEARKKLVDEVIKDGKVFEPLEEKVNSFKLDGSPMRGKKSAKITIVQFADFECPFCATTVTHLLQLEEKYGDAIALVFKNFPLSFHEKARPAAAAAVCAHLQGRFWPFHDELFANRERLGDERFELIASENGLDTKAFRTCIESGRADAQIDADIEAARMAGVRGTPTFFINGRKFNAPGGYTVEAFSAVIDKHILKKTSP